MRSFVLLMLAIIALAILAGQAFEHGFALPTKNSSVSSTSTVQRTATSQPGIVPTQTSPSSFHGPVGEPHIVGPSSNPPDY